MNDIPSYVSYTFATCVIITFGFIYFAVNKAAGRGNNIPIFFTTFIAAWIFIVSLLSLLGFFSNQNIFPPPLFLSLGFLIVLISSLFLFPTTRSFIARLPITTLTYVHVIRVPIEIVLWWLFVFETLDKSMTFQGFNYDILSGISAPIAGLFFVGIKSKSRFAAIAWNILALGLLINIVIRAALATPYFFDSSIHLQPNIAMFYFPYILLPLFVVPVVFFSHLVSLYQLFFVKSYTFLR